MLLERRATPTSARSTSSSTSGNNNNGQQEVLPSTSPTSPEPPLTCMMYFFASQMRQNVQPSSGSDKALRPSQTHPLDNLLSKVSTHAAFSPLVTRFETFPVDIPLPPGRRPQAPREINHDTLLLMSFRSARAREEWIRTREWMEFMERTDREGVFRRLPHVRCAGSVRGLGDVREVLGI